MNLSQKSKVMFPGALWMMLILFEYNLLKKTSFVDFVESKHIEELLPAGNVAHGLVWSHYFGLLQYLLPGWFMLFIFRLHFL